MTSHLFVYGTLMSTAATAAIGKGPRALLARHGRLIGEARVAGRLYDAGRYPVMVEASAPKDRVWGEVWALAEPAKLWPVLDRYEGIGPGEPEAQLYRRVQVEATLAEDGASVMAWTYLYNRAVSGLRRISDGRWLAPRGGLTTPGSSAR